MTRRLIATIANDSGTMIAKVYRDAEWEEYRVEFWKNGEHMEDASYHTDDKAEALQVARQF